MRFYRRAVGRTDGVAVLQSYGFCCTAILQFCKLGILPFCNLKAESFKTGTSAILTNISCGDASFSTIRRAQTARVLCGSLRGVSARWLF